ncbi:AraC family transcriptional regulator [Verrucomicrobium sp. GAS474]|uniref:helix-turn-helix transcriptional regulator n=1 Tax=Verrucomicrobium sp. GAS474 TaxID=1882831 RepID=UPI0012FF714B|nr:AraC family transcriptional regulator [Verrucomicrobium sp. GAS474]
MIETADLRHLQWKQDFKADMLIVAYHFPDHDPEELPHDHDFVELQICVGGKGRQQTAADDFVFSRGKAMVISPGAWHRHYDNKRMDVYVCCFEAKLLMHELLWTLDDPILNLLLWQRFANKGGGLSVLTLDDALLEKCIPALDALVALGENHDPSEKAMRLGNLIVILAHLAKGKLEREVKPTVPAIHVAVRRCLSLMEEHLAEPWTAEGLSEKLNINVSYLGRLFKSMLGVSPMAYLSHMRMERAARLLSQTDRRISEVASDVGWPDPNYFARRFRLYFGISASEYRARQIRHAAEAKANPDDVLFGWSVPEAVSRLDGGKGKAVRVRGPIEA